MFATAGVAAGMRVAATPALFYTFTDDLAAMHSFILLQFVDLYSVKAAWAAFINLATRSLFLGRFYA